MKFLIPKPNPAIYAAALLSLNFALVAPRPAHANGAAVKVATKVSQKLCKAQCRKIIIRSGERMVQAIVELHDAVEAGIEAGKKTWEKTKKRQNKLRRIDILHHLPIPPWRRSR